MADCRPKKIPIPEAAYLPFARPQNPSPPRQQGQQASRSLRDITSAILRAFYQVLPSNYSSQTSGPNYTLQFQALAEQLAKVQLALEEIGLQSDVDFTRPEYLWQMVGTYILPDTAKDPTGTFEVDGDLSYREFLRRMILLILQGSTLATQEEGLELLTDGIIRVLEKVRYTGEPWNGWDIQDQFTFEVNVLCSSLWGDGTRGELGTGFPEDPFLDFRNNQRILRVLKPAHTLYDYRHLFLENVELFEDTYGYNFTSWYYEDFRKFCCGRKSIISEEGLTYGDKTLFKDTSVSFTSILSGAMLLITSGPNASTHPYRVAEVLRMVHADAAERSYVTSPSGLEGTLTILDGGVLEDASQDFSLAVEGEVLTIDSGPNAGDYRLEWVLGLGGGPLGHVTAGIGATKVRVAPTILRMVSRMPELASGQAYELTVERLGVRFPFNVNGEDASSQFYL